MLDVDRRLLSGFTGATFLVCLFLSLLFCCCFLPFVGEPRPPSQKQCEA